MLKIITGTIALLCAFVAFGQTQADTIKVYFDVNRDAFNPGLCDNASVMAQFIEKVDFAKASGTLERIEVYGYSSPDGPQKLNERLSTARCRNIADYIIARTGVDSSLVIAKGLGEAWDELRDIVAANPDVPCRNSVLDILDNTPLWIYGSNGRVIGGRKKQLMDLAGGRPYRWLLANIFPKLRNALCVSIHYAVVEEPEAEEIAEPVDTASVVETIVIDEPEFISEANPDTAFIMEPITADIKDSEDPLYRLAIKNNLVFDAILMPNLELEWLASDRWSVALEGNIAWWGNYANERSYRVCIISPEVRRWIKPRAPWHGMYVGIFAGGGWYDLEKGVPGYRGEGGMAGLSFGYMWPVGKHLLFEAGIGAGYMYTRLKEYRPYEGHHLYLRTRDIQYFGPLKLKFSIAWRFCAAGKPKHIISGI